MTAEVKVGKIYTGRVVSIKDFGAFVEIAPETDGLCHVSELSDKYVDRVDDIVEMGQEVKVKVLLIDDQGRIKLSRKAAMKELGESDPDPVGAPAGGGGDEGGEGDRGGDRPPRREGGGGGGHRGGGDRGPRREGGGGGGGGRRGGGDRGDRGPRRD
jgi:polyribonucleotide nucleotidyltransferase